MVKKFQLSDLKVTSFVTTLNEAEQKTAKGGYFYASSGLVRRRGDRGSYTEFKTQSKGPSYGKGNELIYKLEE